MTQTRQTPATRQKQIAKLGAGVVACFLSFFIGAPAWAKDKCESQETKEKQVTCMAKAMSDLTRCNQLDTPNSVNRCKAVVSINSYDCQKMESISARLECMSAVISLQRQHIWMAKPSASPRQ